MTEQPENPGAGGVAELLEDLGNGGKVLDVAQLPADVFHVRVRAVMMRQFEFGHCVFHLLFGHSARPFGRTGRSPLAF